MLVAYWAIGVLVPIRIGEFAAARGPNVREAVMPPGATEVLWHEVAPPGAPFAVGIGLYAESPLPVRFESIYEPNDWEGFIGMRWRAVWLSDVSGGGFWDPARPFTPVDLGPFPGIWLVGQAGSCAVGPSFDPANLPAALSGYTSREIDLNVSVLGWPRTVRLEPKFKLVEPDLNGCSARNPPPSSPASSSPAPPSP
jgi:hypothetical protein